VIDAAVRLPVAVSISADAQELRRALECIESLCRAANAALPDLVRLQKNLDETFRTTAGTTVDSRLTEYAERSRFDAAEYLPLPGTRPELETDTRQTDLYNALNRLLEQHNDQVVSDIVLVSDGGHNGGPAGRLPERLKETGIRLTIVGVGVPAQGTDSAFRDWQIPPVLPARKQAVARVELKTETNPGQTVDLRLSSGELTLATLTIAVSGTGTDTAELEFRAPDVGQHVLTLELTNNDAHPANNRVHTVVTCVRTTPRVLLIGEQPDWDTTYLYLAMLRAGLNPRQVYHGLEKDGPRRGGAATAIPRTLAQWARNQTVILHGRPFKGFSDEDAQTLHEYVSKRGGNLVICHSAGESYTAKLCPLFEVAAAGTIVEGPLLVPELSRHLPCLRIATDGPKSARWIRDLGVVRRAAVVGAQDFVAVSGQAYRFGIAVGNFDWIGSVPAMLLAAFIFVPYFWKAGLYTIPEYLGKRYNDAVRVIASVNWIIFVCSGM